MASTTIPDDVCRHCTARGDMRRCAETDCSVHESWYAKELAVENTKGKAELITVSAELATLREHARRLRDKLNATLGSWHIGAVCTEQQWADVRTLLEERVGTDGA